MNNKDKWIIGIDLDGTLLRGREYGEHQKVSPFTKKVLHAMEKEGHIVCIDTGRTFYAAKRVYESIGLDSIIINHAGAYVHNPNDDNFDSIQTFLNTKELKDLLSKDKYSKKIISTFIDCDDVTHPYDKVGYVKDKLEEMAIRNFPTVQTSIEAIISKSLSANVVYDVSKHEINDIIEHLGNKYGDFFHVVDWSWPNFDQPIYGIEINVKDAAKGTSLLMLADQLNIPQENTMGIGDSENDRNLMTSSSVGVAMKNASDEIKELANIVLDKKNTEEGVAHFLNERFKLGVKE